jgi:hypothetical protein
MFPGRLGGPAEPTFMLSYSVPNGLFPVPMRRPSFPNVLPAGVRLDTLAPSFAPPEGAEPGPEIPFSPVPRIRNRRSGWTPERQRGFIAALARCGSVRAAARHVGLSPRTAYKLLDMPDADSFAAAWDQAVDIGRERLRVDALERSLNGAFVPIYRRGKLVRVEYRRCDRLAIALLGGKDRDIGDTGRALRRARLSADFRALDLGRDAEEWERAGREERYDAELKAMLERGREIERLARQPRIRSL